MEIIIYAELVLMSIRYSKKIGDLILKNSIAWTVHLFNLICIDTKNVELKLKFSSNNWIGFLIQLFELNLQKIELKKGQFGTKTQLQKHSLDRSDKHSNSIPHSNNDGLKKFYSIGPSIGHR